MNNKPFTSCKLTNEMLKDVIINPNSEKNLEEVENSLNKQGFTNTLVNLSKLPY